MIAVITGDIIDSRTIKDQSQWIVPLKKMLKNLGIKQEQWEIYRGDSFQIETKSITRVLEYAIAIKALIKSIKYNNSKYLGLDVRMAIGIGKRDYKGDTIIENNGTAYVRSGELFEKIKLNRTNLAISSPFEEFDNDMNLYFKLAMLIMDGWTGNSAELMHVILNDKNLKQKEIGKSLGIGQNAVSGRYARAHIEEVQLTIEKFESKIQKFMGL